MTRSSFIFHKGKQVLWCLFFLLVGSKLLGQSIESSGEVHMMTLESTKADLPFWFYSNQRGRVSEDTRISGWFSGNAQYHLNENSVLSLGAGLLYQDGLSDRLQLDELFLNYSNSWIKITAGKEHKTELFGGISSSDENLLWSINAPAIPGVKIQTIRPVYFKPEGRWGFEAQWGEYWLGKQRFVKGARVHHKSLHLVYRNYTGLQVKVGIQHFAQWAGTSPDFGKQPATFRDYLRIVTGRGGAEGARQGDVENALGNHLGSYELWIKNRFSNSEAGLFYNSIFEDGSGSRFDNFPDGRYGIFFRTADKNKWVNSLIYEFYYTKNQSHDVNTWGADNYLGHFLMYNSGWTYKNRIIGSPFFTYDPELVLIINNKFIVHHLGIAGQASVLSQIHPYKVLVSFANNEGTFKRALNPKGLDEQVLSLYSEIRLVNGPFQLDLELGSDFNSYKDPNFGAGLHLVYRLWNFAGQAM